MRWYAIATCTAAIMAIGGCAGATTPGTPRSLGQVDYQSAFATGRETLAQYFTVASAKVESGLITARPSTAEMAPARLLGRAASRRTASLHIYKRDGLVYAHLSIAIQREGTDLYHTYTANRENYSQVPDKTPAEEAAATTPKQNEAWETIGYDHALERHILDDLHLALHPTKQ